MLSRYDSALSGLLDLIVIMEQLLGMTKQTEDIGCYVCWVGWVWQLFQSNVLYKDDDEMKQASESYLESMQQEFYLTGIKKLFDKCNICICLLYTSDAADE